MSKQITGQVEIELDWDSITGPDETDLETMPEIEAEYLAAAEYVALAPSASEVAAMRRRVIRAATAVVPGSMEVRAAVDWLNRIARRRTALAVIDSISARIESVERVEDMIYGQDVDRVHSTSYPLVSVLSAREVIVYPVRFTVRVAELINSAGSAHHAALAALEISPATSFALAPETLAAIDWDSELATVADTRAALDTAYRRYVPKSLAWDGTADHMVTLIRTNAPHRASIIADRAPVPPRMRRAHKANQATGKRARDLAMADAIDRAMGTVDSSDREDKADLRPTVALVYAGVRLQFDSAENIDAIAARWAGKGLTAENIVALESWVNEAATNKAREMRRYAARKRLDAGKHWAPRGYDVQGTGVAMDRLANSLTRSR